MINALRFVVSVPSAVGLAVWEWLTHDEFQEFIEDQCERFAAMAKKHRRQP